MLTKESIWSHSIKNAEFFLSLEIIFLGDWSEGEESTGMKTTYKDGMDVALNWVVRKEPRGYTLTEVKSKRLGE